MKLKYHENLRWQDLARVEGPFFAHSKVDYELKSSRSRLWHASIYDPLDSLYKNHRREIDPYALKSLFEKIASAQVLLVHSFESEVVSPAFIWKADDSLPDKGKWHISEHAGSDSQFYLNWILNNVSKPKPRGSIKQKDVTIDDKYGYIPSAKKRANNVITEQKEATRSNKVGKVKLSTVPKNKQATVKKSVEEGYALTNKALASLKKVESGDKAAIANYETYFGKYSKKNYDKVKQSYVAIKGAFEKEISVKVDDTSNAYAYVYPGGKNEVFLGKAFWGASTSGFDSKGGVFVHELAHEVAGAKDIVYGNAGAKKLASTKPLKAITNADNYEYYAESL